MPEVQHQQRAVRRAQLPAPRPSRRRRRGGSRLRRSDGASQGQRTRQRDDYALKVKPRGIALSAQRSSEEIGFDPGSREASGQRTCCAPRTVARHRRHDGSGRRVCFRLPPVSCGRNGGAWSHEAMRRKPPELTPRPVRNPYQPRNTTAHRLPENQAVARSPEQALCEPQNRSRG